MDLNSIAVLLCSLSISSVLSSTIELIAQQPGNVLDDFLSYRHISVIHFDVPENILSVAFKFTAKEVKSGGLGECNPRYVTINIKSGSLPLVRPDGSRIEAKLLKSRRRNYTIEIESNGDEHIINIAAPPAGDWYAIAYRSWLDPNNDKIKQQGLAVSCDTVLDAEMSIDYPDRVFPLGLDTTATKRFVRLTRLADSAIMQFRIPRNVEHSKLTINSSCAEECSLTVHVTAADHILGGRVNASVAVFNFRPYDDEAVHYVTLRLETGNSSEVTVDFAYEQADSDYLNDVTLTRKTLPDFFLFDYDHLPPNATKNAPMNLTVDSLTVLRFKVGPVYDTGGTLSVGLRLAEDDNKESKENVSLVGCLSLGYYPIIGPSGGCIHHQQQQIEVTDAADIYSVNRSSPGFIHVPYPEPGVWYLTVRAFNVNSTDCYCFENCVLNGTDCDTDCHCAQEVDARVETSIASHSCIEGACNEHGKCSYHMSGGIVFSACHCTGGYRGFDCADDDYVLSTRQVMIRVALLTVSNLAFIGAIVVAVKRNYYTEAVVYAAVMFFSTFYHACEAGDEDHSFCLLKLNVLQFCDFYNALLSIWVTLVAMASLGRRTTSFCHMVGVVILAVGAEMDRTALWVFLLPAFFGCGLVVVSWALKCRQKGTLAYPARIYRLVYLPIGLIVVIAGLICYAFLQTRSNYHIVHSLWHVCVAVGAALILPKREYMQ